MPISKKYSADILVAGKAIFSVKGGSASGGEIKKAIEELKKI